MGFKVKRKVYKLTFADDTDLAGLEISVRSLDTRQFLELNAARAASEGADEDATHKMLRLLANNVVSWNVEDDDGEPIPLTKDSLLAQELSFNIQIIHAWSAAIAGVPAPLEQPSSDGLPSVEASIPMESLSSSLAS